LRLESEETENPQKPGEGVVVPFYRYECEDCAAVFKLLQQNGSSSSATCPHCGSRKAKRLLPRIGVIYKGNGYYTTDSRAKQGNAAADKAED